MLSMCASSLLVLMAAAGSGESRPAGDDALSLALSVDARGPRETAFAVDGVALPGLEGLPWAVETDAGLVTPAGDRVAFEDGEEAGEAVLRGDGEAFSWRLRYFLSGPGRITKELELRPKRDVVLRRVFLWRASGGPVPETAGTSLQDIAVFYREGGRGMFASLDFPYSKSVREDAAVGIAYPPHVSVKAGETYRTHTLTLGATRLSGETRYGRDTGEVAAMDAYIQERHTPRFEKPLYVSACINNRYTMLHPGGVWYTYKDHPTLVSHLDLLRSEIALMPELGMEYYQLFPGVFDWVPDDPDREVVREISDLARQHGIRVGDYSGCNSVFCGHYNEYGNTLDRPEWRMRGTDGGHGGFCFGHPDFVDYYTGVVVPNAREFDFALHCLDFLSLGPCWADDHGHPAGEESVYHQVLGLTRFMEALNAVDPEMMTWSNSGNWQEFLPKIAWWNQNLYLTDPFIGTAWQGLNMTRLLDDARREQMVSLHYTHFLPYRFYTNCQYFFSQNSISPDIRNYRYGALATLAVTPNLCLAEIRPWLDTLPERQRDEVTAFYKKWTAFVKDNFELWKNTHHIGDNPGPGNVEVYSHAKGDRGFVFLVNPTAAGRTLEIPLDARLGFDATGPCELVELFPEERLLLTAQGPYAEYGSTLPLRVEAQQVRVIEVRRAPDTVAEPRLYGLPGTITREGDGWQLATRGMQGTTHRFAVVMPDGASPITAAAVREDIPWQAKRLFAPTPLEVLGGRGQATLFEITFRRTAPPTELSAWQARPGDEDSGLAAQWQAGFEDGASLRFPLSETAAPLARFQGACIENAFGEIQETYITLRADGSPRPDVLPAVEMTLDDAETPAELDSAQSEWWLSTRFHLPFMYGYGCEPPLQDHTFLVLPFTDVGAVKGVRAWVNGEEIEIRQYRYPRNRGLYTYWGDLVGTAARGLTDNTLVLHIRF